MNEVYLSLRILSKQTILANFPGNVVIAHFSKLYLKSNSQNLKKAVRVYKLPLHYRNKYDTNHLRFKKIQMKKKLKKTSKIAKPKRSGKKVQNFHHNKLYKELSDSYKEANFEAKHSLWELSRKKQWTDKNQNQPIIFS